MYEQIFYGILGIMAGFVFLLKAHKFVDFSGRINWAENFFGGAGTYTFIRILGIVIIFVSFLYMVGLAGTIYLLVVKFLYKILGSIG